MRSFLLLLLILISCSSPQKSENSLTVFSSDGCSLYPDGSWLHCCIVHDMSYWAGGDEEEKNAADEEQEKCIAQSSSTFNAKLMTTGVHIGGSPNNVLPWAWGYGWKNNLGYSKLNDQQLAEVEHHFESIILVVREYEDQLSKKQFAYVIDHYQQRKMKLTRELKK